MKFNIVAYILIIILIIIILFQNKCSRPRPSKETVDTVVVFKHVVDTFYKSSPPKIVIKKDTVWQKAPENAPDTTYRELRLQYITLGNKFFERKTISTPFSIGKYGTITVHDSISQNNLLNQYITTDLKFPETTITTEKKVHYRKFYGGFSLTGTKTDPVNGIFGDILFKTRKDQIYNIGIGYQKELTFKGGIFWPIGKKKIKI